MEEYRPRLFDANQALTCLLSSLRSVEVAASPITVFASPAKSCWSNAADSARSQMTASNDSLFRYAYSVAMEVLP